MTMRGVYWSLRRTAMVGVAIGSVACAAAMTWALELGELSIAQLLVILALYLLPGVTLAAWCLDRRHKRESVVEDNGLFEMPAGVEVEEESPERHVGREVEGPRPRMHQPHRRRGAGRVMER